MEAVDSDTAQQREDAIGQLFAAMAAIHRPLLGLIRRHGLSEVWKDDGAQSMFDWLQTRFGLDRRSTREHVRVAESLFELPQIASAFEDGRIRGTRFGTSPSLRLQTVMKNWPIWLPACRLVNSSEWPIEHAS
ncbi:MAG: DUF222 domain-containing protein [Acidimicrobiia bacterium]|nr:DUF222 domain-containing protein [Acidimicrobiia bacterium]